MQKAIITGALAGLASVFLYGALTPGIFLFAPLMFVAPMPLMLAGFSVHPLVAAFGGLAACLFIDIGIGPRNALSYGLMIALPSYLATAGLNHLVSRLPNGTDARLAGQIIGVYLLGGIALYSVAAVVGGAMWMEPDHALFEARLSSAVERMLTAFSAGTPDMQFDAELAPQLTQAFVKMFLPISAVIIAMALVLSLWLAIKLAARSGKLPFAPLPAYFISLPRDVLFWFAGALLLGQLSGFSGIAGASATAVILFLLVLNGLSLLHARTLGKNARAVLLWGAWGGLMLFAPSALIFVLIGALDAAFNLRSGTGNSPT